jgi:hypothetical protein
MTKTIDNYLAEARAPLDELVGLFVGPTGEGRAEVRAALNKLYDACTPGEDPVFNST